MLKSSPRPLPLPMSLTGICKMCLTIPAKIIKLKNNNKAIADFQSKKQEVDTQLVDNVKPGEYALISNGFIVKKIPAIEAEKIIKTIKGE
jgi:hydrogenase assembly chaperone HypC/HupF